MSDSLFIRTLKGEKTERPPVWFMRQAGRVLPSYLKLREQYSFSELMQSPQLAAKVTLLPVEELGVDAAILFSDILVIPAALGMKLEFTDSGPRFEKALKDLSDPLALLNPDASKLEYIYKVIDEVQRTKPSGFPLIGFLRSAVYDTLLYGAGIKFEPYLPGGCSFIIQKQDAGSPIIGPYYGIIHRIRSESGQTRRFGLSDLRDPCRTDPVRIIFRTDHALCEKDSRSCDAAWLPRYLPAQRVRYRNLTHYSGRDQFSEYRLANSDR